MNAYLDNSATTRCFDEVRELMNGVMDSHYGNPSSMHNIGVDAEKYIREAKETLAKTLKCQEKEIIFTSGGTESDNMAIIGGALANKRVGNHIITTKIEHPAVLETFKYMESLGYETTYLGVDESGCVNLDELKNALRDDTVLVSVMHVNNEIGSCQPIEEIGKIVKEHNEKTLFHVDSVQGYGKYKINPKKANIDMLSVSGHKIHGPKGIGFLYIKDKVKVNPIIFGGGQQKGMRSGTENVPAIAGLSKAAEIIYTDFDKKIDNLYKLKEMFISELKTIDDVRINGVKDDIRETAPHVISASFKGVRAEVLLHALEDKGIYVSSGSACASNKPAISETLKAINLPKELLDSTVRFSFSVETNEEQLRYTIDVLKEIIPTLRKYSRH
ncbi:MAG: cysteine desulfurase family protein [Lachnospiraceae bacterium]|nr:cysteine desulfurase family protein [Lachnospiraceae bacterium]